MWSDWVRAGRGALQSVFAHRAAGAPDRVRHRIDEVAAKRGAASWFDRFEPHALESDGRRIHLDVIERESPVGTFVFMPGTNAYTLLYGEFLVAVADLGWDVVAFDPRGHGRSSGARGSYTVPELVQDYATVVRHVRARSDGPVVVSGSSQGGIVAFYFALKDRQIDGVICHNLADLSDPSSAELTRFGAASAKMRPLIQALARAVPEAPVPMQAYLDLRREPIRGQGHALQVLLEDPLIPWFVRLKTLASLGSEPPPAPIESFDRPLLVLQAGDDTIFPTAYIRRLVDRVPGAQLEVFEDLPHYMIVDHVDAVVPRVRDWLAQFHR